MSSFAASILTPNGKVFEAQVDFVSAPGQEGSFGVLGGHAAMVAALKKGTLTVKQAGEERSFSIAPGVLEVNDRHEVLVLVSEASAV